ncbi:unnamed protein product, partial [Mesorhabditis spiculigera]
MYVFEPAIPPPTDRVTRGRYTVSKLDRAIKLVLKDGYSCYKASHITGVPRTTVQKRIAAIRSQMGQQSTSAMQGMATSNISNNSFGGDMNMYDVANVEVIEFVEVPSFELPDGTYLVSDDGLIPQEYIPMCHETLHLSCVEQPKRFLGQAFITQTMRITCLWLAAKKAVEVEPRLFPLFLYKNILRLHYGLPPPMRVMGDAYVKDEFRRHKSSVPPQSMEFLQEWTQYCATLSKQLHGTGLKDSIGKNMEPGQFEKFSEEQLHQLLELKEEAEKPLPEDKKVPGSGGSCKAASS